VNRRHFLSTILGLLAAPLLPRRRVPASVSPPAFYLTVRPRLADAERDQLREKILESYCGAALNHLDRAIVLDGLVVQTKPLTATPRELNFVP
jgi:hypothetical protein